MNTITVSGTTQEVNATLKRLSEVIKNRKTHGFQTLVHKAEWMFITERDERVCYFCQKLEHTIHRGDYIPKRFPLYHIIDSRHIAPEIHLLYPFLRGACRCVLELMNVVEVCEEQLHKDKLKVL